MSRKKISRNAPCPCGSGKKYKNCCYGKGFTWEEGDDGEILRSFPMDEELAGEMRNHLDALREKLGRPLEDDDLLFGDAPPLEHLEHEMSQAMQQAGIDPAVVYAFEKTGRLVSEENIDRLTDAELDEWEAAIREYNEKHGRRTEVEYPIGTVALYGPDDEVTTKIAAGVIMYDGAEVIVERWVGTGVTDNPKVQQEIDEFFKRHGVNQVVGVDGNIGCPHEEGKDFPLGEDCPFCPFWKGKQGSARREDWW